MLNLAAVQKQRAWEQRMRALAMRLRLAEMRRG
jgi:hypothetical protein